MGPGLRIPVLSALGPLLFVLWVALGFVHAGGNNQGPVILLGSGSSFIYPQMSVWIEEFHHRYSEVRVSYNPTGSGTGQKQFFARLVDFAASDPPVKRSMWIEHRGELIQLPIVLGAVAVVYNLPEVESVLRMDGEVLAKIYLGEVRYWDDPAIRKLNPDVELPHKPIIAVHRSDSSGTTHVFTFFLHKAAPEVWPEDLVGKSIEWPVDARGNGAGGKGNQGVTQLLLNTPYSIGYVELSYAIENGMSVAKVRNAAGEFVLPDEESVMRAAKGAFRRLPKSPLDDFSEDLDFIVYSDEDGAYPIASFVHLLLWRSYDSRAKAEALRRFVEFVNTEGQGMLATGYFPIPAEIRALNLRALGLMKP